VDFLTSAPVLVFVLGIGHLLDLWHEQPVASFRDASRSKL
jgi:hypothetical protein